MVLQYRRVGTSGLKVSAVALGSWITYGGQVGEEVAEACVRRAYAAGVTYFDTADVYQDGRAEEILGRCLKGLPRSRLVVATKAFWPAGEAPTERGLSRKHVIEAVHGSLRRLGMDYVDIFFCHRYDPETPVEETLRAIDDLIRQGKVLYAGVSEWTAAQIQEGLGIADRLGLDRVVVNQPVYNLFHRGIEREVLPLARREGIGQVVFSPLAQGLLTGKYRRGQPPPEGSRAAGANPHLARQLTDATLSRVERLERLAAEAGLSLARMAVAWTLRDPVVASAIVGASRPEQLDDTLAAADVTLPPDLVERIDAVLAE